MSLELKPLSSSSVLSDEEVLARSIKQPSLFKILVERYEAAFVRKVKRILGEREEVQDVVVETFTKIYFHTSQFKSQPGASFSSWAYRILLNTTFSYYKKLKLGGRKSFAFSEFEPRTLPEPAVEFEDSATLRDWVASLLVRLPTSLARILRLYFLEDYSQMEIALNEGLSLAAVKTRIHRAKEEFRRLEFASGQYESRN